MKLAIVDDRLDEAEVFSKRCLAWAGEQDVEMEICCYQSGEKFLEDFQEDRFSLVFMDIYMGGESGIETAMRMRELDRRVLLVFLTASGAHMPEAFSCRAFDYLVKPGGEAQLARLLQDALRLLPHADGPLLLPLGQSHVKINVGELVCAVSQGHYLQLSLEKREDLRCRMTMAALMELLGEDERFLTINRGILVNMDYVDSCRDGVCRMRDGRTYPLLQRERKRIEERLEDHRFKRMHAAQDWGQP